MRKVLFIILWISSALIFSGCSDTTNMTDHSDHKNSGSETFPSKFQCKRIVVVVNETGSYLAENDSEQHQNGFRKISGISTGDISLNKELVIRIRADKGLKIGDWNGESDNKCGGCGKMTLKIEYTGEKIYQPKISEILSSPREFENKKKWCLPCIPLAGYAMENQRPFRLVLADQQRWSMMTPDACMVMETFLLEEFCLLKSTG